MSSLFDMCKEYPIVVSYTIRVETFELTSVSHPNYRCKVEEHIFYSLAEVKMSISDIFDEIQDGGALEGGFCRHSFLDDFSFLWEELAPWAEIPTRRRINAYVLVRLAKERDPEYADDRWVILTECLIDSLAQIRALQAWERSEPDYEPDTYITYPEGWAEIESGTEPDTEPEPHLTLGQVAMMTSDKIVPEGLTYGYLYLSIETHDKILSGSHRYALPYAWERAIDEARALGRGILGLVCGMIDAEPESYVESRSYPNSEVVWLNQDYYIKECFSQLGLQRITLEWGFQRVEPDQRESVGAYVGERLWIGVATWDGRDLGKRTLTYASNRRADLANWAKGTAEAAALLMDTEWLSQIDGTSTLQGTDESYRDIHVSVGFRSPTDNPEFVVKGYRLL